MKNLRKNTVAVIIDVNNFSVVSQHSSFELAEKKWVGYPQEIIYVGWLNNQEESLDDAVYSYAKDTYVRL